MTSFYTHNTPVQDGRNAVIMLSKNPLSNLFELDPALEKRKDHGDTIQSKSAARMTGGDSHRIGKACADGPCPGDAMITLPLKSYTSL
jgi:hypothetical protein